MAGKSDRVFKGIAARRNILGARVSKATAALPQGTVDPLFTILGGRVLLTGLVGEVTTAIQSAAANIKIQSNPTTGTTVDIAADLNATSDEIGCMYGITGAFGDAVVGTNAGATVLLSHPVVLDIGTLDLECGESVTGNIKWIATYMPWDETGEMVPA